MSSKRAIRRNQCTGKVRHTSTEHAMAARRAIVRSNPNSAGKLNVYRCDFCGGHHVGHRKGSGRRPA